MISTMKQKRPNYHSYLIRLWRSSDDETASWHIMLENPHTRERHSFATLGDMLAYLQQVLANSQFDDSRR